MMKRRGNPLKGRGTAALSALALVLLAGSMAGSSRAALTYYSENYTAQIEMYDIGVTLVENGRDVSWRNYTQRDDVWSEHTGELLAELEESVKPGKVYPEQLCVRNSGSIDSYVRVLLYCYWEDERGKRTDLSPELIRLNLTGDGWVEEPEKGESRERTVLYYTSVLPAEGNSTTPAFADTLMIDESVSRMLEKGEKAQVSVEDAGKGSGSIRTVYAYDGLRFVLEAEVDAVQTHNAEEAIKSAWGADVEIGADGSLRLK